MNSIEVENLFAQTLMGNHDDDEPWDAVNKLRSIGSREVFDIAKKWCQSPIAKKRARGADVLAQIGQTIEHHSNAFPEESYKEVSELLKKETEIESISSCISALGHIGNNSAIPLIVNYITHPNEDIRFAVTCALGAFPDDSVSIINLIKLTSDTDDDVRDYATFGLGNLGSVDTPEIREALFLRLNDNFENARLEAIVGLAKRKDSRVVRVLLPILQRTRVPNGAIEAACFLLDLETENKDWTAKDYAAAIQKIKF